MSDQKNTIAQKRIPDWDELSKDLELASAAVDYLDTSSSLATVEEATVFIRDRFDVGLNCPYIAEQIIIATARRAIAKETT